MKIFKRNRKFDSTENDSEKNCEIFINKTIKILHKSIDSNDCLNFIKRKYHTLNDNYNVPIKGECADLHDDIRFLLNIYKSDTMDFKDLNPELSLIAKIELLIEKSRMILNGKCQSELPNLYKTYRRWLIIDNQKIEVELILDKGYDKVYKSKKDEKLFLEFLEWRNGGYITRTRVISNEEFGEINN
jgi:hypothetical protein